MKCATEYFGSQDWIDTKFGMMNCTVPVYKMNNFSKSSDIMIVGEIKENGMCIIDVLLSKEDNDNLLIFRATAMIDTGATFTTISGRLANKMQLERQNIQLLVKGFNAKDIKDGVKTNFSISELFGSSFVPMTMPVKENMEESKFDIVIGADILNMLNFVRKGIERTFTLEM